MKKIDQKDLKFAFSGATVYQRRAHRFANYGENHNYAFAGLAEECGEALGKYAKFIRKHEGQEPCDYSLSDLVKSTCPQWSKDNLKFRQDLKAELGDICWFVAEICSTYGLKLGDVLAHNIEKLSERKAKGVIVGEGDTTEERLSNAKKAEKPKKRA